MLYCVYTKKKDNFLFGRVLEIIFQYSSHYIAKM